MSFRLIFAVLAVLAMGGCGSDAEESGSYVNGDESRPGQVDSLPGWQRSEPLVITPRTYTGGTVKAKVTGFFKVDGNQSLNVPASITDEDQTWLQYGVSGGPGLDVLFTNSQSMAEHGVTVGEGPNSVTTTSTSGECQSKVDVTPTRVTGRYSCTGAMGYNRDTGQMGEVDVEVEFSADS